MTLFCPKKDHYWNIRIAFLLLLLGDNRTAYWTDTLLSLYLQNNLFYNTIELVGGLQSYSAFGNLKIYGQWSTSNKCNCYKNVVCTKWVCIKVYENNVTWTKLLLYRKLFTSHMFPTRNEQFQKPMLLLSTYYVLHRLVNRERRLDFYAWKLEKLYMMSRKSFRQ